MRSYILPAAIVAALGITSAAFAATKTEGVIKAFDLKAHTLTLADGSVYMLPTDFKDPGLKAGEKVAIMWDMKNSMHEASQVTIVK